MFCHKLQAVNLENCPIEDRHLEGLTRDCSELRVIDLTDCDRITDEGLRMMSENCPQLTHVSLYPYKNTRMSYTIRGVKILAENCKKLTNLYLSYFFSDDRDDADIWENFQVERPGITFFGRLSWNPVYEPPDRVKQVWEA